jgi:small-conductance mechanosensitive channel
LTGQIAQWIPPFSQVIQVPYELLLKLATVGVILIATWIVSRILGSFVSKAVGKINPNVARQARRIVTWLTWLIGILIGLDQLGLELTMLLVILTLGGIILVISFRDILSNAASREIITAYNLFKIGDWIQVGKCFGRVVDVNWIVTTLMTLDNEMVHIPNSEITKSTVINRTAPGETRISVPLTVDDTLDLSGVEKILLEIGTELSEDLAPDSKPEVRVTDVNNRAVKLALLLKINNPAKGSLIASEVRKKAKERLDAVRGKTSQQDAYS